MKKIKKIGTHFYLWFPNTWAIYKIIWYEQKIVIAPIVWAVVYSAAYPVVYSIIGMPILTDLLSQKEPNFKPLLIPGCAFVVWEIIKFSRKYFAPWFLRLRNKFVLKFKNSRIKKHSLVSYEDAEVARFRNRVERAQDFFGSLDSKAKGQNSLISACVKVFFGATMSALLPLPVVVLIVLLMLVEVLIIDRYNKRSYRRSVSDKAILARARQNSSEGLLEESRLLLHYRTNYFDKFWIQYNKAYKAYEEYSIKEKIDELSLEDSQRFIGFVGYAIIIAYVGYIYMTTHALVNLAALYGAYKFTSDGVSNIGRVFSEQWSIAMRLRDIAWFDTYIKKQSSDEEVKVDVDFKNEFIVECRNLSYKYFNSKSWVLENVNIKLDLKNNMYALMGENGNGKTTFVMLLLGFYKPTHGEILINGISVQNITTSCLRNMFEFYSQEYYCYAAFTLKEFLDPGNKFADDEVIKVLYELGLEKKISEVGIHVRIGRRFADGTEFSTGQQMRLLVARSILSGMGLCGAFVGDEVTASADNGAQQRIFKVISKYFSGGLFVTHSDILKECCDEVLICRDGKITTQRVREMV